MMQLFVRKLDLNTEQDYHFAFAKGDDPMVVSDVVIHTFIIEGMIVNPATIMNNSTIARMAKAIAEVLANAE